MPEDDPREELEELIKLYENGCMPKEAYEWACGALNTAESILQTIEDMQEDNRDAPTLDQEKALKNIYDAACRWLKRK
jgi:hypothetical protein|tara:strand:+ start:295 stop:528 length:234 start_codon:yes stop_codon:yes gene_type:complete